MFPCLVAFDRYRKAICAGCPAEIVDCSYRKVVQLPGNNADFIEYNVKGRTEEEILTDTQEAQ